MPSKISEVCGRQICHCNSQLQSSQCVSHHTTSPTFFPPIWRQLKRSLTSATIEQLLISINGLRLTCGFMRLRAFFIPFIRLRFLLLRRLCVMIHLRSLESHKNQRSNNTSIFGKCTFIEKCLSMTKHYKCHKTFEES